MISQSSALLSFLKSSVLQDTRVRVNGLPLKIHTLIHITYSIKLLICGYNVMATVCVALILFDSSTEDLFCASYKH